MTISTETGRQKPQAFDGAAFGRLLDGMGVSPEAFGRRVGASRSAVEAWIAERQEPRYGYVVRICRELGLSTDYFDKSKRK